MSPLSKFALPVLQQRIFRSMIKQSREQLISNSLPRSVFTSQFNHLSNPTKQAYLKKMKQSMEWRRADISIDQVFKYYSHSDQMGHAEYVNMMNKLNLAETVDIAVDLGIANSPKTKQN